MELKAHSYQHPTGRCDGCEFPEDRHQNGCCDEPVLRPLSQYCAVHCDAVATYCLRPVRSTGIYCEEVIAGTEVSLDTNIKTFSVGETEFFGIANPLQLTISEDFVVSIRS